MERALTGNSQTGRERERKQETVVDGSRRDDVKKLPF